MPVGLAGYIIIGDEVGDNIILEVSEGPLVIVAIAFVIINLLGTYVICMNPVDQAMEEIFKVPKSKVPFRSFSLLFVPRITALINFLFYGSSWIIFILRLN